MKDGAEKESAVLIGDPHGCNSAVGQDVDATIDRGLDTCAPENVKIEAKERSRGLAAYPTRTMSSSVGSIQSVRQSASVTKAQLDEAVVPETMLQNRDAFATPVKHGPADAQLWQYESFPVPRRDLSHIGHVKKCQQQVRETASGTSAPAPFQERLGI